MWIIKNSTNHKNKLIYSLQKDELKIYFLTLTILSFLLRTSIPILKYPFIVFYIASIFISVVLIRKKFLFLITDFIKSFYLVIILTFSLLISFLLTYKLYLIVFKEVASVLILLSLFFMLSIVITSKKALFSFLSILIRFMLFFAVLVSLSGFFGYSKVFMFEQVNYTFRSLSEESPYIDWNFALLPVFFGIFIVFHFLTNNNSKLQITFYNLLLAFFSFYILFSKSRRGIILLFLIIFLLLLIKLVSYFKTNSYIEKIITASRYYLLSLSLFAFLIYLFIFHTSFQFKNSVVKFFAEEKLLILKSNIASNIHRNITSFNINISSTEFYDKLWTVKFDPKDPDEGGWGTCIHKTIYPLVGNNSHIIPEGSKGYMLDSTCNVIEWNGNAYSETKLFERYVGMEDSIIASVDCFVSNDYNGESVYLNLEGINGLISNDEYDISQKNSWQTLKLCAKSNKEGNIRIIFGFWRYKTTDFSGLEGHVIFANPQYEILEAQDSSFCTSCVDDALKVNCIKSAMIQSSLLPINKVKSHISYTHHYLLSPEKRSINSSIITAPLLILGYQENKLTDKDPVRNWVSKLISEDTTYIGLSENIIKDPITDSFIGMRTARWKFAWRIFLREYNWKQKILGGGFSFLNWYGYHFENDKTKSDYPHNPFLSILLYSGLFGLTLYMILIYNVFYFYIKHLKEYLILFIFFLITFFFSFFSAGNPFDPPFMGFFVILSFFLKKIHQFDNPTLR